MPDITTQAGLCDIMALGNVCELGKILERASYLGKLDEDYAEECETAGWHYRQFQRWFADNYAIMVGDTLIDPMSVFQRSLVQFALAAENQRYIYNDEYPVEGCSGFILAHRILSFMELEREELTECFNNLLFTVGGGPHDHAFCWTGPAFTIRPRQETDASKETREFEDFQLFGAESSESSESSEESDETPLAQQRLKRKAKVSQPLFKYEHKIKLFIIGHKVDKGSLERPNRLLHFDALLLCIGWFFLHLYTCHARIN